MQPRSRELAILVYGATGYTGRLIASELKARGASFAIAGRDSSSLKALADSLGVQALVAPLDDRAALVSALSRAAVVVGCAGPYSSTGELLFSAAVKTNTHLLDLAGEPAFLARSMAQHEEAMAAGIAVVHAVGFRVVVAQALCWLSTRTTPKPALLELASVVTAGVPSAGSLQSYLCALDEGAGQVGAHRRVVNFPAPFGPRAAVEAPSPEAALFPKSLQCREFRFYFGTLAPEALAVAERGLPQISREQLSRGLAQQREQGQAGPDQAARAATAFAFWLRAVDQAQQERIHTLWGTDPYGLTATVCAQAAIDAASPQFAVTGVRAPIDAFDPQRLLASIARAGGRWNRE